MNYINYAAPPGFGGCEHPGLIATAATYAVGDATNPGRIIYTVHVRVNCPHCNASFRFLGDNALAPTSLPEALQDKRGAWVSGTQDEMACIVAPIEPGEVLANVAVHGRA